MKLTPSQRFISQNQIDKDVNIDMLIDDAEGHALANIGSTGSWEDFVDDVFVAIMSDLPITAKIASNEDAIYDICKDVCKDVWHDLWSRK